jgi:hypothetical protein
MATDLEVEHLESHSCNDEEIVKKWAEDNNIQSSQIIVMGYAIDPCGTSHVLILYRNHL